MIHYLEEQQVLDLHNALVEMFQEDSDPIDPPGVRDVNLFSSACARPRTGYGEVEKYRTVPEKVAALLHSLVCNHVFHNGNKRTALMAGVAMLQANQFALTADDDACFDLVVGIAAGEFPRANHGLSDDQVVAEITSWIRNNSMSRKDAPSALPTLEFLDRVRELGGDYRDAGKGVAWLVLGPDRGRSVRIGKDTRKLDGNVVKNYLTKLGLSEAFTGVAHGEFQTGLVTNKDLIRRYRGVLKRLAEYDRR